MQQCTYPIYPINRMDRINTINKVYKQDLHISNMKKRADITLDVDLCEHP